MKKKLIVMISIMIIMVLNMTLSYANTTYGIYLTISPKEIKVGETFTVTLSAKCSDGINGIDTTYSYDKSKLELVSAEIADSKKWSSLGIDNQITVICNSTEKITEADIYVLTFKVKETVKAGDVAIIETTDILLDSDAATDSENTIKAKKLSITVGEEPKQEEPDKEEEKPTKPDDGKGEETQPKPEDGKGDEVQPNPDDSKGDDIKPEPDEGIEDEKGTDKSITVKVGEKDNTVSSNKLPDAGANIAILVAVAILVVISIVLYKKYKKYKNL